jgi:glc operon protein GlcG
MIPTRTLFRVFLVLALVSCGPPSTPARDEKQAPPAGVTTPLVSRERIRLNLAGAEVILAASKKKASALGLKENIAVVDDGGHLLAFARMDGARPASGYTAMTKAVTAATFRQETGTLPPKGEPDLLLNLSLQNAALASGGKLTTLKGGVPVVVDGQVIGAVGVGGGTGEQDAEVARAGVQALVHALEGKKR